MIPKSHTFEIVQQCAFSARIHVQTRENKHLLGIPSTLVGHTYSGQLAVVYFSARYSWDACFAAPPDLTFVLPAGPIAERIRRRKREMMINPAPTMINVRVSGRAVSDVMIACTYWSTASTVPKHRFCKRSIFSNLQWFCVGTGRKLGKAMGFDGISLPTFPKLRRVTLHRLTQNAGARVRRTRIQPLPVPSFAHFL